GGRVVWVGGGGGGGAENLRWVGGDGQLEFLGPLDQRHTLARGQAARNSKDERTVRYRSDQSHRHRRRRIRRRTGAVPQKLRETRPRGPGGRHKAQIFSLRDAEIDEPHARPGWVFVFPAKGEKDGM